MRRFTFSVMLALATVAVNAQETAAPTWTTNLTTTESASDLHRGGAMAIDNEGNSIVTGSFDKDLEFADSYLEPVATSAFIAKYDKAGNKKWAAGLSGAATITAVTTDADGNIYAAGVFADLVKILDYAGNTKETINGMADQTAQVSGFIVKYNKAGEYQASKVVIPEQARTDEGYGDPYPYFSPSKILVSGNKVYLAASYQGKCKIADDLILAGQYGSLYGIYTWDVPTLGIISLGSDNLNNTSHADLVAQLAATDNETEVGYGAENINFATDGSKVYAGFVAYGTDLTLRATNDSKQITDLLTQTDGENTQYEHGFILATIENGNITDTKIYHSQPNGNYAKFNTIDEMTYHNGNLYLAGTFNEAFPFDNSKSYAGGCDTYLASLKASDLSQNWAVTSGYDEKDAMHNAEVVTGMAIYDDEVQLTGWSEATSGHKVITPLNFYIDTENKTPSEMSIHTGDDAILATSVAHNGLYAITQSDNKQVEGATEGTYTYSFYSNEDDPTGILQIAATADNTINFDGNTVTLAKSADITLYTVSGALVKSVKNATSLSLDNVANGIYLLKAGKQTVKIVK